MDLMVENDTDSEAGRRVSARRTAWLLAAIAAVVYLAFIGAAALK